MKLDDPQNPAPVPDPAPLDSTPQDAADGDFPIEGDGGLIDSGGQAHVPPPPPAC